MSIGRGRAWTGGILVGLGATIALAEVALHFYIAVAVNSGSHYDPNHRDLLIALVMSFAGFYVLNPKGAKDGGQFLVDNSVKMIQAVRLGRRKTDMIGVVTTKDTGETEIVKVVPDLEIPMQTDNDSPKRRVSDAPLPPAAPTQEEHP